MKKRICAILAVLMLTLAGCRAQETAVITEFTEAEPTETEAEPTVVIAPTRPSEPEATEAELDAARMAAFQFVLQQFLFEHVTPDGLEIWYSPDFGSMEDNVFAIADVDGDGERELVLEYSTCPMAGMMGWVYGYDAEQDSVYEELLEFPALSFYTGGLAEAGWSHNQGLAGEALWPYTLYGYDPASRTYVTIASVDAWCRAEHETDYEGNPYPEDLDPDGEGVLYYLTQNGETRILTASEYTAWRIDTFGSSTPIALDFRNTNEENIREVFPER